MIVSRTPFRITLGGGGTDLPSFYEKHGGYILALGIDQYMYVSLNVPNADRYVRLHYTQSEVVENVRDLKHELAREALIRHGINDGIEIASLADLPAGTGLGSSSCYLVGLLNAIRAYLLRPANVETLAEEACDIELRTLKKPIGKQDQFMAAAGGLTELHIDRDGKVRINAIPMHGYAIAQLVANMHMYYTNVRRDTTEILSEQNNALRRQTGTVEDNMLRIREIGYEIADAIRAENFNRFGELLHEHWMQKRQLSNKVTVDSVERLYDHVRSEFGVLGGKVVGAGGGGFLMLYCPGDGKKLTEFMAAQGMTRLDYGAEHEGSRIVLNTLRSRSMPLHDERGSIVPSHLLAPVVAHAAAGRGLSAQNGER